MRFHQRRCVLFNKKKYNSSCCAPPHLINTICIDRSRPSGPARLPESRSILTSSKMSSLLSFPISSGGNGHLLNRRKSIAHSIEKLPSGAIFCRPPTFGPISTLTGGQEDQTLRQEVKGARTHCWSPSVQTFDSPRKRSTHLSSVPPLPRPRLPPAFPRSFSSSPSRLPLDPGKASAGNPKKWTVGFRRVRATHTRRNSFAACTRATRYTRIIDA